ncbi:hypothetical protein K1J22_22140, partial [Enterobacter kobei]|uniref:hypothetical protein n=1 Tax=Enterobacter kobei TaxID=208224 RepID=UPI003CC84A3F|nr:hypothetical protein [Enterobacter kobei]
GYHQTNQKTDTGKTLTRWPVLVDHNTSINIEGRHKLQQAVREFHLGKEIAGLLLLIHSNSSFLFG